MDYQDSLAKAVAVGVKGMSFSAKKTRLPYGVLNVAQQPGRGIKQRTDPINGSEEEE